MAANVTVTFVADIPDELDGVLEIELDEDKNNGETEFLFDTGICWFRVYSDLNYEIESSKGTVDPTERPGATTEKVIEETIQFSGTSGSVSKPIKSGTLQLIAYDGVGIPGTVAETGGAGFEISAENGFVGQMDMKYTTEYYSHNLSNVPMGMTLEEYLAEYPNNEGIPVYVVVRTIV